MSAAPAAKAVDRVPVRTGEAADRTAAKRPGRRVALARNGLPVRPGARIASGASINTAGRAGRTGLIGATVRSGARGRTGIDVAVPVEAAADFAAMRGLARPFLGRSG